MKFSHLLITLLIGLTAHSQQLDTVDATIDLYPTSFQSPEAFSKLLTRDFASDEHKIRAIYTWLIKNVAYEPSEYKQFNYQFKNYNERNQKEEKTRKKIIERTLQKGIAVCEGYAMVFEKMCQLQGITSYLVRGDIKTSFNDIDRPFKKVHMWNVAMIEEEPFLFDATWGAGKYRERFIREPSYYFYRIAPSMLIKTHMPHIPEDSFLKEPPSKEVFAQRPLIIDRSIEIMDLSLQTKGRISSEIEQGVIPFRIKDKSVESITYSFGNELKEIPFSEENNYLIFSIPMELGVSQLLIYFDDQPALGYKIK